VMEMRNRYFIWKRHTPRPMPRHAASFWADGRAPDRNGCGVVLCAAVEGAAVVPCHRNGKGTVAVPALSARIPRTAGAARVHTGRRAPEPQLTTGSTE